MDKRVHWSTFTGSLIEGKLKPQTSVNFLARTLNDNGDSIDVSMTTAYVTDVLKLYGMENSKPSPTTGASTVSNIQPGPLDRNEHKKYRAIVGKTFVAGTDQT